MADISYLQNDDLDDSDEAMEDEDDEEINRGLGDGGGSEDCRDDGAEGGGGGGGGGGEEGGGGGEQLSPLAKLQQHATSDTSYNRQMVGRILVEIFRAAVDCGIELVVDEIMKPVRLIIDDREAPIRSDLVEQLPHVAMICQEAPNLFGDVLTRHLLGIVVKYLSDPDNQVRQTAQASLLVLMERGLLDKDYIEYVVCPVVLNLTLTPEDFLTSNIALMSKMVPLVGREITEKLFLDRFVTLCSDNAFFVRKVCASNIGEFCAVVSEEVVENVLLPRFVALCRDDVWGVRKACADVIMSVSFYVSLHHRQFTLAPIFATLLNDESRWVRTSAFQILGPFISTFAQQFTGLTYNQYGELIFTNQQGTELRISYSGSSEVSFNKSVIYTEMLNQPYNEDEDESQDNVRQTVIIQSKSNPANESTASNVNKENEPVQDTGSSVNEEARANEIKQEKSNEAETLEDVDKFNPFLYYYISPDLPLDQKLVGSEGSASKSQDNFEATREKVASSADNEFHRSASISEGTNENTETLLNYENKNENQCEDKQENEKEDESENDTGNSSVSIQNTSELLNDTVSVSNASADKNAAWLNEKGERIASGNFTYQSIVPQVLIDYFVSMSEPNQMIEVGAEIPHHCAFSFPAVALTLGKKNWPLLKNAYQGLASAMQWKVRRTLASSIHEIAMILGEDLASRDLVPIYDGFIKDLDEVRIGALKHLATFLKVLGPIERYEYLPRLNDFLVTDNEWNWRFREELATQLLEAVTLYSPLHVSRHIAPLSVHLLVDKIAAVRHVALALVTQIISHLAAEEALVTALIRELGDMLAAHSDKWTRRQTYALLCSHLISSGAITGERFAREMLPFLLNLSWDRVPNVRLAVARTLARNVATMSPEWLGAEQAEEVEKKLKEMQKDLDRDVRELASLARGQ
ncbi:serine/threonine-protein phosphatase 4 regulatory subunit 1 isoform X2 [Cephus cinctus]|uniref:Serine/threonine-protein phosphatase 4 regulatory subunit 1 isoform X2 n=1 Tax=Cephus cinctus TaxID=211228 RepID=A0AAJ7CBZ2_CEPCN|nr:serine/threonine-protein phosphatase 4 regulatory subunit 1 isoform X2 [Cephus cinctus]